MCYNIQTHCALQAILRETKTKQKRKIHHVKCSDANYCHSFKDKKIFLSNSELYLTIVNQHILQGSPEKCSYLCKNIETPYSTGSSQIQHSIAYFHSHLFLFYSLAFVSGWFLCILMLILFCLL